MRINKIGCWLSSMTLLVGLIACGNDTSKTEPSAPAEQQGRVPDQSPAAAQPAASRGRIVEKINASDFTYVRLDDGTGNEIWAAVPRTQLEIGEEIALKDAAVMRNFNSKSLNRTFDTLIIATGVVRGPGTETAPKPGLSTDRFLDAVQSEVDAQGLNSESSSGSSRAIVPFTGASVEKSTAPNGYTVGELFDKAAELNKQKVTVKGRVVKFSPNIMGRNWIHIQDGTGDPMKNTHDLVVTSSAVAQEGAIVSLEGVLAADKDFGFGYRYDVIVEDAVIVE